MEINKRQIFVKPWKELYSKKKKLCVCFLKYVPKKRNKGALEFEGPWDIELWKKENDKTKLIKRWKNVMEEISWGPLQNQNSKKPLFVDPFSEIYRDA